MTLSKNDHLIESEILDDHNYDVRPDGTIWTRWSRNGAGLIPKGQWRKIGSSDTDGYVQVNLTMAASRRGEYRNKKKIFAHRIVFLKYVGPLNDRLVINHKNGIKSDNRPENLEQITSYENTMHSIKVLKNYPLHNFKLSYEIAQEIRELKKQGMIHKEIMYRYGISKSTVSYIINNKIWVNP
jgi:hypothetical protein